MRMLKFNEMLLGECMTDLSMFIDKIDIEKNQTKPNPTQPKQTKSHSNMIGMKNENILNDLLILDWDTIWTEPLEETKTETFFYDQPLYVYMARSLIRARK